MFFSVLHEFEKVVNNHDKKLSNDVSPSNLEYDIVITLFLSENCRWKKPIKSLFHFINLHSELVFIKMRSDPSPIRTSMDFPGLLLFFVEIISDQVILDHKKSYLVF